VIVGPTLEIDLGERLVVIPAYRLGVSPAQAAGAIEACREARPDDPTRGPGPVSS
jgi:hypothetical protein